jgi:hypothetical protein
MRTACSLASAPPLVKKTLLSSPGVSSEMSRAASDRASLAFWGATVHSLAACSRMAATTLGCWWPMLVNTSCEEKSSNRFPSPSQM